MANFDFDMLKKKASEVADKTVLFAKKATDKAVETAKVAKLNADIVAEKDKLKKIYQQIGKLYCDLHMDSPESEFVQAINTVNSIKATIKGKRTEIEALRAANSSPDFSANIPDDDICEAEYDTVEDDGIPETEEAGNEADLFDDVTEDSIPETEEAPLTEETAE